MRGGEAVSLTDKPAMPAPTYEQLAETVRRQTREICRMAKLIRELQGEMASANALIKTKWRRSKPSVKSI